MNRKTLALAVAALAVGTIVAGAPTASASTNFNYVTVTPDNFQAIFSGGESRPMSSFAFVTGPAKPPLGDGSLELTTVDAAGKQQHLETQQQGTKIAAIDMMGYGTYQHPGSTPQVVASINMEIFTNPGLPTCASGTPPILGETCNRYTTLAFEPYLNGIVTPGAWQLWDAYRGGNALWHPSYTRPIPGSDSTGAPVPWNALVAANPNAIVLSYGVNQGSANPNVISNVDALTIGTAARRTVYDFEPSNSHGGHGQGGDSDGNNNRHDNGQNENN